jgi:hypothetical protein
VSTVHDTHSEPARHGACFWLIDVLVGHGGARSLDDGSHRLGRPAQAAQAPPPMHRAALIGSGASSAGTGRPAEVARS